MVPKYNPHKIQDGGGMMGDMIIPSNNKKFYKVSFYTDTPELVDYSKCKIVDDVIVIKHN